MSNSLNLELWIQIYSLLTKGFSVIVVFLFSKKKKKKKNGAYVIELFPLQVTLFAPLHNMHMEANAFLRVGTPLRYYRAYICYSTMSANTISVLVRRKKKGTDTATSKYNISLHVALKIYALIIDS